MTWIEGAKCCCGILVHNSSTEAEESLWVVCLAAILVLSCTAIRGPTYASADTKEKKIRDHVLRSSVRRHGRSQEYILMNPPFKGSCNELAAVSITHLQVIVTVESLAANMAGELRRPHQNLGRCGNPILCFKPQVLSHSQLHDLLRAAVVGLIISINVVAIVTALRRGTCILPSSAGTSFHAVVIVRGSWRPDVQCHRHIIHVRIFLTCITRISCR